MKNFSKHSVLVGLTIFVVSMFIHLNAFAGVTVYAEGIYSAEKLVLYTYADIDGSVELRSACVKVSYDPSQLNVTSAVKNGDVWSLGNNPYMDPETSTPGEVIIILGKIDPANPSAGVSGNRVLLGTITFGPPAGSSMLSDPSGSITGIGYGRGGAFSNFVDTNQPANVLDGTASISFGSITIIADEDIDSDGDGFSDVDETACGSDPLNDASTCEVCDGVDNDIDGEVDEGFTNTDGDTEANCVDLDDDNDGISDIDEEACGSDPINAASTCEVCDGVDNDLNEGVDEGFADTDSDGTTDCVDPDDDNDGTSDELDNCPSVANPDQNDNDADALGDVCDPCPNDPNNDADGDGICGDVDNCPDVANPGQEDSDGNGVGDACDVGCQDADQDGICDDSDICPNTAGGTTVNSEGCSIVQLCPCEASWKNHGAYVKCVAHASDDFVTVGLITEDQKDAIVSQAARSDCGVKK